ncbi:unnamed protein product [Agarophyton chilense]
MATEKAPRPTSAITRRALLQVCGLMMLQTPASSAAVRVADPSAGSEIERTQTGLQYYDFILPEEDKPSVGSTSVVTVHYTLGTTGARNGWRIDSTYDREPFTFRMGSKDVISGMEEGVLGMRVGGKRRLLIPSTIGYRNANDRPLPKGFAEFQRFKNIYLNPDRVYKPDIVIDVTVLRVR